MMATVYNQDGDCQQPRWRRLKLAWRSQHAEQNNVHFLYSVHWWTRWTLVCLMRVSLCPCRHEALQRSAPIPKGSPRPHINTQHPPPGEQQELALEDYERRKEERRSFQEDSHLLLSPAVDHEQKKKKPPSL